MRAGHHHSHAHPHAHALGGATGAEHSRRLALTLGLVVLYMVAEIVGGVLSGSLALIADAGHMLSDAGALGLSLFAIWLAQRPPSAQHTYGFYRTEILAALANAAALVAISLYIFVEAFRRIGEPPEVQGTLMMAIAVGGLAINLAGLWILNAGKGENLNVQGAWLHVLSDALGSVGAIIAGALIWFQGWYWADPAASILIGLLVIYSSWALLRDSVAVLMEGAPGHIDVDSLRDSVRTIPGVTSVHDLHVWTISSGLVAMSGHVTVRPEHFTPEKSAEIRRLVHDDYGIDHATIQLETVNDDECQLIV